MMSSRLLLAFGMLNAFGILLACGAATPVTEGPPTTHIEEEGAGDPRSDCGTEPVCTTRCDTGDPGACEWLGRMHETGEGAAQDYRQAADFYRRACDAGRADSCAHLAMMYDIGLAVGESSERARELYDKACNGGNRWACKRVAQLNR